ncbi:MAG: 5-(carboxyamino)imidazole ribonucleotide synthase [Bacteroidia bacterium]|nr:5-(carboxyamino)imidazole ribonucleotide synthase [Bacteroidia bacterium]
MSKKSINELRIGMLGGGQLGLMLMQQAACYNLNVHILDPDPNAPAKNLCTKFTCGDFKDYETVLEFGKNKDILTIEIEHVNTDALKKLKEQGKKIYPDPEILETIQDKGLQKMFLQKNNIPTPDFFLIEKKTDIEKYKNFFPFVQKLRKGGYDGKGVFKLNHIHQIESAFDAPSLLERKVEIKHEISVIVARNSRGETKTFPSVMCEFHPEANLVEFLYSPSGIPKKTEKKASEVAIQIVEKMNFFGLMAVEFFINKDGEVLVNELAPRVHNSGHHTIEGNITSQFDQFWRSILDLPLGDTSTIRPAVMINLLGEPGHSGKTKYIGLENVLQFKGVYVHLYNKIETRPMRKMGHITITGETIEQAIEKAKMIKKLIKVICD